MWRPSLGSAPRYAHADAGEAVSGRPSRAPQPKRQRQPSRGGQRPRADAGRSQDQGVRSKQPEQPRRVWSKPGGTSAPIQAAQAQAQPAVRRVWRKGTNAAQTVSGSDPTVVVKAGDEKPEDGDSNRPGLAETTGEADARAADVDGTTSVHVKDEEYVETTDEGALAAKEEALEEIRKAAEEERRQRREMMAEIAEQHKKAEEEHKKQREQEKKRAEKHNRLVGEIALLENVLTWCQSILPKEAEKGLEDTDVQYKHIEGAEQLRNKETRMKEEMLVEPSAVRKRDAKKKVKINAKDVAIKHNVDTFRFFDHLGIPPPFSTAEIPPIMRELDKRLVVCRAKLTVTGTVRADADLAIDVEAAAQERSKVDGPGDGFWDDEENVGAPGLAQETQGEAVEAESSDSPQLQVETGEIVGQESAAVDIEEDQCGADEEDKEQVGSAAVASGDEDEVTNQDADTSAQLKGDMDEAAVHEDSEGVAVDGHHDGTSADDSRLTLEGDVITENEELRVADIEVQCDGEDVQREQAESKFTAKVGEHEHKDDGAGDTAGKADHQVEMHEASALQECSVVGVETHCDGDVEPGEQMPQHETAKGDDDEAGGDKSAAPLNIQVEKDDTASPEDFASVDADDHSSGGDREEQAGSAASRDEEVEGEMILGAAAS